MKMDSLMSLIKNTKRPFCGVEAYHRNGIVKNKKNIMTTDARTLLLHSIKLWQKMIDEIFFPFAIKYTAEWLNSLYIDHKVRSPEHILHIVNTEEIPVKSFHTLFSPIYVIYARIQNSGEAGKPKWELRSRIGVYLGHLPLHYGSVALV